MVNEKRSGASSTLFTIMIWGGMWGIFEATVGYLLHLLPFSVGWIVWYPVACFFMLNVYRKTHRADAVLMVGFLSACIKIANLFLPVRIDMVINPAVSIVFEAIALSATIYIVKRFFSDKEQTFLSKGIAIIAMNTGWRMLYALYLLLLVPDWMREISVISSAKSFITFFVVHNISTCMVLLFGSLVIDHIIKPIREFEEKISDFLSAFPQRTVAGVKITLAVCLICVSIALQILL